MKKTLFSMLLLTTLGCLVASAQTVKLHGVYENHRVDNHSNYNYTDWVGSIYDENGNYLFALSIVPQGLYAMTWDGTTLTTPEKEPAVVKSDIIQGSQVDVDKARWAKNFNLMVGNSGAVYADGTVTTVMSRDYQSTEDDELFVVRKWDAKTGNLLNANEEFHHASENLESAGMSYNPADGKVYGLFYLTAQQLPTEITSDPDFFTDEDGEASSEDAGYCLCSVDLPTMTITPITKGLYYQNFVTFAINSEGRAFALTSGGVNSTATDANGRLIDINNRVTGAQLCEFDLATGLMKTKSVQAVDDTTGETYTEQVNVYDNGTGFSSQYRRQSACFAKSNPSKMYWVGYYNSGKGINDYGSWGTLSDKNWKENGKYDTALYEVDINTGLGTRLAKITDRYMFSALWVEADDSSDGSGVNGIENITATRRAATSGAAWNLAGQRVGDSYHGIVIVDGKKVIR